MIIALDRAIPYWEDAFLPLGEIRPFSGNEVKPADVRGADALIVRSITPVNDFLLDDCSVRFVGAVSAGVDHVDQDYLAKRGIHFAFAAGCNADAASEYAITALLAVASRKEWQLEKKSLAVIGAGYVGSRVAEKAHLLGMKVLLCDPPLRNKTGDSRFRDLGDVLEADILSFHVPLVFEGPYATWHMMDQPVLERLSPKQFLINTSRGAVFDDLELKSALRKQKIDGAILDVWEGEPRIDYSLLELVDIGTPHIAGTGLDGKINATEMVRARLCRFFNIQTCGDAHYGYPKSRTIQPEEDFSDQAVISSVIGLAYDIEADDEKLRALKHMDVKQAAESFQQLRSNHPLRPEFRHFTVNLSKRHEHLTDTFEGLGFKTRAPKRGREG